MTKNYISSSFGFEWGRYLEGKVEKFTVFGRSVKTDLEYFHHATGYRKIDIIGKIILDAGCGSGKLTYELTKFKPKMVYGIDNHSTISLVQKKYRKIPNLKIINADIFTLPFQKNYFDLIWCNGVIHHTPDPYLAFQNLAEVVKSGGKLYIWVYEKRFSPYKFTKDIFRLTKLDRIPYPILFSICKIISALSVIIHKIYKFITFPIVPFFSKSKYFLNSRRNRSYEEFLMTWFDALSPQYDYRFTRKEVAKWFIDNGFTNLKYYWDQVGICGIKE